MSRISFSAVPGDLPLMEQLAAVEGTFGAMMRARDAKDEAYEAYLASEDTHLGFPESTWDAYVAAWVVYSEATDAWEAEGEPSPTITFV